MDNFSEINILFKECKNIISFSRNSIFSEGVYFAGHFCPLKLQKGGFQGNWGKTL